MKPILVRGQPLGGGKRPALCAPLVGATQAALLEEAGKVAAFRPDIVEWRVDYFGEIANAARVLEAAAAVRGALPGVPLLFTRRSSIEGGQSIPLSEAEVVALYGQVCAARCAELVDFEMGRDGAHVRAVREAARASGVGLVLSFHDFARTPPADELLARFRTAAELGADVAKVAVMPKGMEDVLALLAATLQASRELPLPLISMSMGPLGALSRVAGFAFGSALTFGVGAAASAPGQIGLAELRAAVETLSRSLGQ